MSKCINTAPVVVCYTDAGGLKTSLLEHVVYEAGIAIGQVFTTADDTETPFDVSTGTVVAGACPVFTPDVEWEQRCDDTLNDGTVVVPFMCQVVTSFDPSGVPIAPSVVTNYGLDKTTPYTVLGTVLDECPCVPKGSLGTITDWADLT